jgi:nicotinamidase/pyrazinamidase
MTRALILVDIQNDFLPGGALGVPDGDGVIPVANRLQEHFDRVYATRDWHPADHGSFASQHPGRSPGEWIELGGVSQILWPDHCVQHSKGAEMAPGLDTRKIGKYFFKGRDRGIDSYSAFFDNGHLQATGLEACLREEGVDEVVLAGLATDYCVKFSALDARQLGFRTVVVEDACRGVELEPGDTDRALDEMRAAGVRIVRSGDVAGSER